CTMHIQITIYQFGCFSYGNIQLLSIVLPAINALIVFNRLKQADDILQECIEKDSEKVNLRYKLKLFHHFHADIRRSVWSQNRIFGKQLLQNLIIFTPGNAFVLMSI